MFSQAMQSAFSLSHKVDARQDSNTSITSKASVDSSSHADTPARSSSSSALAFLTRGIPEIIQQWLEQPLTCTVVL